MMPRMPVALLAAAMLALAGCAASGDGEGGRSGEVTGVVLAAPACPVVRVDEPCPPRPVAGALVEAFEGDDLRGTTRTGNDGSFRLELPHGSYLVTATNTGGLATTASEAVMVSDTPVELELVVDSGIR